MRHLGGPEPAGRHSRAFVLDGADLGAELHERTASQSRDVDLRDPNLPGDLRLAQPRKELQCQQPPLALAERPKACCK